MRCRAPTESGRPCGRAAAAGKTVCTMHSQTAEPEREGSFNDPHADSQATEPEGGGGVNDSRVAEPGGSFYGEPLSPDQLAALARAAGLEGVDAELAVMRVLVHQGVSTGHRAEARRAVETVARLVKIKHDLGITQEAQLTTSLDRVLDTLAQDLGVPL